MRRKIISFVCAIAMTAPYTLALNSMAGATPESGYVLSGNTLTDADKALYSENYGIDLECLETDSTYRWSADTQTSDSLNSSLKTGDTNHSDENESVYGEITAGSIVNTGVPIATFGTGSKWNEVSSTVEFDLGAVYRVSSVDIWDIAGKGISSRLGAVEIWAGEKANDMERVWIGEGACDLTLDEYNSAEVTWSGVPAVNHQRTSAEFDEVDARFVKIKLSRDTGKSGWTDGNMIFVSEILIFGDLSEGETNVEAVKAKAKAEAALENKKYYTSESVTALEDAIDSGAADEILFALNSLVPKGEYIYSIVSGNNTALISDWYENWSVGAFETMPPVADNSPSYSWEENGNAGTSSDNTGIRLTNANAMWSNWNSGPATVIFDLGGKCAIDRIDLIERRNSNAALGYVEVYTSENGEDFEKILATRAISEAQGDYYLWKFDFPITETRYVAVSMTDSLAKPQFIAEEVVIYGYEELSVSFVKDKLHSMLEEYKNIESANYTGDSYAAFKAAYEAAEDTYWDEESTSEQVNAALNALAGAYKSLVKDVQIKILAGKKSGTYNINNYQSYDVEKIDLTYDYLEGSNDEIISGDPNREKLLQGADFATHNSSTTTWGTWASALPAQVCFNLGGEYYVTGVDVWELYNSGATRAGRVVVSASDDGISFTEISSVTSSKTDDEENCANLISQSFDAAKCRYLLVTVERGASAQIALNEIVLKGYAAEKKAEIPFFIENIDYKDESGERIISMQGATSVTLDGRIVSNAEETKDITVISVVYNGNDIAGWDYRETEIPAYSSSMFSYTIPAGGDSIYTFVWDSLADGAALSEQSRFANSASPDDDREINDTLLEYDIENKRLEISGSLDKNPGAVLQEATVRVIKPGFSPDSFGEMPKEQVKAAVVYLAQTTLSDDGSFKFTYEPESVENGYYTIYAAAPDGSVIRDRIMLIDSVESENVLDSLNAAATKEEMKAVLGNKTYLTDGVAEFEEIAAEYGEDALIDAVAGMVAGESFASADQAVREIIASAVVAAINAADTAEDAAYIINTYKIGLGLEDNDIYNEVFTTFEEEVSANFVGQDYTAVDAFIADFCETVLVEKLQSVTNYVDIMPIITAGREYLEDLDYDAYEKLSQSKKTSVAMKLAEADLSTAEKITEAFNDAVEAAKGSSGGSSGSGGSGSSGGSGAGVINTGTNTQTPSPTKAPTEVPEGEIFSDLDAVSWAEDSILTLYEKGIVSGMAEGKFAPLENVTREQFAKMLVSAYSLYNEAAECGFADADPNEWYYRYIASAAGSGIVYGVSDTEFGVGRLITREDMAVMACRAMYLGQKFRKGEEAAKFADDESIAAYAKAAIYALRNSGVMSGKGANMFEPKAFATRAEAARIIHGLIAGYEETEATDVTQSEADVKKYAALKAMGFFADNTSYNSNASVTRGEIVTAIFDALPEDKKTDYTGSEKIFDDVTADDSVADAAYAAKRLGMLGGETKLRPMEKATLDDAAFMLLNLMGYGNMEIDDYSSYAAGLGLMKSVSATSVLTLKQFAAMLYNALDIEVLQWKYTDGADKLVTVAGETLMSEIFEIYEGKGQVKATRFTGIEGEKPTGGSAVKIGSERYLAEGGDAEGYIGQVVKYYYRITDSGDNILLYAEPQRDDTVLEIDAECIRRYENLTYTYVEDYYSTRTKTAEFLKSAQIIYNGKMIDGSFSSFKPENGSVRLVDNNRDRIYEVVIITDYEAVTVGMIDAVEGLIIDKYDPDLSYEIDQYGEDESLSVELADGTTKKFADIRENYPIFIARSEDEALTKILINEDYVEGSLKAVDDEEINIDGIIYKAAPGVAARTGIGTKSYGIFRFDPKGRIAAFEGSIDDSIKSGYLVKAYRDEDDDSVILRIFTEAGKTEDINAAEKVFYTNGRDALPERTRTEDMDELHSLLSNIISANNGSLILYRQNSQGRISEIELPAAYESSIERSKMLSQNGIFRQITQRLYESHKNGLFNLSTRIGPETKIYFIPEDLGDRDKFQYLGTSNSLAWNQKYTYAAFAKNEESEYADYLIGYVGTTAAGIDENNLFIVSKIRRELNENDEPIKVVEGIWGSSERTLPLTVAMSENEIAPGDIYRLAINGRGEVADMRKVISADQTNPSESGVLTEKYYSYFGYAYDLRGTTLRTALKNPQDITSVGELVATFTDQMPAIYHFDLETKELTQIEYSQIKTYERAGMTCSKVFAWFYYADHKIMVVYD